MTMLRGPCFLIGIGVSSVAPAPMGFFAFAISQPRRAQELLTLAAGMDLMSVIYHGMLGWMAVAFIAILPIAFGTAAMAGLGAQFAWARSWPAWAMAGAIPPLCIAIVTREAFEGPQAGLMFMLIGTSCALVSRAFIQWAGPATQA